MYVRSRRRFVRRLVALGWFLSMTLGGLYLSTAWWPRLVRWVHQTVDAETFNRAARGAVIAVSAAAVLSMTWWSWAQLRHGGLARLIDTLRGRRDR